jgi:hypothetical protein
MKPPRGIVSESRGERRRREKEVKAGWGRVLDRRAAVQASGAGFHVDDELREFLSLYNARLDESVDDPSMPFSFGIMQGFLELRRDDRFVSYEPAAERDHAYSVGDFVEFVREGRCQDAGRARLEALPEGVVHNFTALGDIREHAFVDTDGEAFAVSGMSLVRRGTRLHWMMIGGTVCDLAEATEKLRAFYRHIQTEGEIVVNRDQGVDFDKQVAAPLSDVDGVWKTVAFGLFDLDRMTHESRTFSRDEGQSRTMVSDDPASLGIDDVSRATPAQLEGMKAFAARVDEHRIVFDVAETLFQLPAYFAYRVHLVREVERRTAAGRGAGVDAARVLRAPRDSRIGVRRIETLEILNLEAAGGTRSYTPPRFQVDVGGFWRTLRPGSIGKDRNGRPEPGRTWIEGHLRWRDRPARSGVVTVKAPIGPALERAERLRAAGAVVSMTVTD